MQEIDEIQDLWTLLNEEASQEKDAGPPKVEGIAQTPTFLDRLAQRFASGVLPLFLLGLAPLLPFSLIGGLAGILIGLILLFLVCWVLAPLARRRGYSSFPNLLLLLLPVVVYATAAAIVPTQLSEVHIHRLAAFYQLAIESVLSVGGLAFCLVIIGILGGVSFKLSKHHPWSRTQPASIARVIAAWLIALAPFLSYGALWAMSAPSEAELAFRAKFRAPTHESTDRYEAIYTEYNLTSEKTPDFLVGLSERLIAESQVGLPSYQRDGDLVVFLTNELMKPAFPHLSLEQQQELVYLRLYSHCLARPLEGAPRARNEFRESLMPALLESPDFAKWEQRLDLLTESLSESNIQELEYNAWRYLYGLKQFEPEVFGVQKGQQERRKVYLDALRQLRQDAIPKPKPLTLFGREWNASPTQLAERWTKHKIANEWMDLRGDLKGLQPNDQLRAVTERGVRGKLPPNMRAQLLKGSYSVYLRPWVQTGSLIIKLRKSKEANGAYPKELSGIVSADQKNRWIWESTPAGWTLTDTSLTRGPDGQNWNWVLP